MFGTFLEEILRPKCVLYLSGIGLKKFDNYVSFSYILYFTVVLWVVLPKGARLLALLCTDPAVSLMM